MDVQWRNLSLAEVNTPGPLRLYNQSYNLASLDAQELEYINAQLPTLLAPPTSIQRILQMQRIDAYVAGIRAVKEKLNGPPFRGLNPGDTELGFQLIRPQFVQIAGAYRTNWLQLALVANAWTNFASNAAGVGYQVGQDFGLIITHLTALVTPTPLESEYRFSIGRTVLIPQPCRSLRVGDNENQVSILPIPTVYAEPRVQLFSAIKADVNGNAELEWGGLVVGYGRVLNELIPVWV